jgi:predicted nucleic acid-binding protein
VSDPVRVDANILLRFLTGEPQDHAERTRMLFERISQGQERVLLDEVILAEVVWTLNKTYRRSKQDVAADLLALLSEDGIVCDDKGVLSRAMTFFASLNLSFADALLAAKALDDDPPAVYSFDRSLSRVPGLRRFEPDQQAS